jgi:predicted HTH domain antitoxin
MTLSVELPDAVAKQMRLQGADGQRRALEILALEGYRTGDLSHGQVARMLGFGFFETEEFLKVHDAPAGLGAEEHEIGLQNLERAMRR